MSFAFLVALAGAVYTSSQAGPLADRYFEANSATNPTECVPSLCNELPGSTCIVINPGFVTYKSTTGQPDCATPIQLRQQP
jgi:hypothetical protein